MLLGKKFVSGNWDGAAGAGAGGAAGSALKKLEESVADWDREDAAEVAAQVRAGLRAEVGVDSFCGCKTADGTVGGGRGSWRGEF